MKFKDCFQAIGSLWLCTQDCSCLKNAMKMLRILQYQVSKECGVSNCIKIRFQLPIKNFWWNTLQHFPLFCTIRCSFTESQSFIWRTAIKVLWISGKFTLVMNSDCVNLRNAMFTIVLSARYGLQYIRCNQQGKG